jgi:hypothetical protein
MAIGVGLCRARQDVGGAETPPNLIAAEAEAAEPRR